MEGVWIGVRVGAVSYNQTATYHPRSGPHLAHMDSTRGPDLVGHCCCLDKYHESVLIG